MPTYLKIQTGPLQWSRHKMAQEVRDLKVHMAQLGAPKSSVDAFEWPPKPEHGKTEKPPEPTLIHLKCKSCGTAGGTWFSSAFSACPTCGQRKTVVKATVRRMVPPYGATVVA